MNVCEAEVYEALRIADRRNERLMDKRWFRATVVGTLAATTGSLATVRRPGNTTSEGPYWCAGPLYIPRAGDDVWCEWLDRQTAVVRGTATGLADYLDITRAPSGPTLITQTYPGGLLPATVPMDPPASVQANGVYSAVDGLYCLVGLTGAVFVRASVLVSASTGDNGDIFLWARGADQTVWTPIGAGNARANDPRLVVGFGRVSGLVPLQFSLIQLGLSCDSATIAYIPPRNSGRACWFEVHASVQLAAPPTTFIAPVTLPTVTALSTHSGPR